MRLLILFVMFCALGLAQVKNVLKVAPSEAIKAKAGAIVKAAISVRIDEGFHVNSDKPKESFLIPLRLTWSPGALKSDQITFPKPQLEHYGFSASAVSVFTGNFEIVTRFKIAPDAPVGPGEVAGKLRYLACNDRECLIPRTVDVTLPVEIVK